MRTIFTLLLAMMAYVAKASEQWPPVTFSHVVAYCYDWSQDPRGESITFPDGTLHSGVIRATTLRLDKTQISKLRTLLSSESKTENGESECYEPHHAFVFYDAAWKVLASIDICFFCEDANARPAGVAQVMDLQAFEAFCRDIGLPMLDNSPDYTALYMQERPKDVIKEDNKPVDVGIPSGEVDPFTEEE